MDELTNIGTIKALCEKYGFHFSKSLGQNFIVNPSICPKIAEMGGAREDIGVIEIGTGFGVLTNELAKRAKKVVAIELDTRLLAVLDETLAEYDNITIINEDILKVDLNAVIKEHFDGMRVIVCANLPYYITSPVIMYLLESRLPIDAITVMVQKEAGVRLCAKMGTRESSAITAAVRYYSDPKLLFHVSRGSFMPSPNVDSCVVRLDVKQDKTLTAEDEKVLFRVIRGAFSQRRKTLLNSLVAAFSMDKQVIADVISKADISLTARPEELLLDDFMKLATMLKEKIDI